MNDTPRTSFAAGVRQNLIAGLLATAPLVVTIWVLQWIVVSLDDKVYSVLPVSTRIPGFGILVALVVVFSAGFIARTYFGKFMNHLIDALFEKVPVVRALYSSTKQISGAFLSADAASTFKKVVFVPFPSADQRALAFVSGAFSPTESFVFVPTAPNPTSGYVLVYPNAKLVDAHMDVDDALKVIVSCGFLSAKGGPSS